jgi:hypothetical protein
MRVVDGDGVIEVRRLVRRLKERNEEYPEGAQSAREEDYADCGNVGRAPGQD